MNDILGGLASACESWICFSAGRGAFSLRGLPGFQKETSKLFEAVDAVLKHQVQNGDFMPFIRKRLTSNAADSSDWRRFLEEKLMECGLTEAVAAILDPDDVLRTHYDSNAIVFRRKGEFLALLYNAEHYSAVEPNSLDEIKLAERGKRKLSRKVNPSPTGAVAKIIPTHRRALSTSYESFPNIRPELGHRRSASDTNPAASSSTSSFPAVTPTFPPTGEQQPLKGSTNNVSVSQLERENAYIILSEAVMQGLAKVNFEQESGLAEEHFHKSLAVKLESSSRKIDRSFGSSSISTPSTVLSEDSDFDQDFCLRGTSSSSAENLALQLLVQAGLKERQNSETVDWVLRRSLELSSGEDKLTDEQKPLRTDLVLQLVDKKRSSTCVMSDQNWVCRGCSVPIDQKYIKTFRFCAYYGSFFCTTCHFNRTNIVPAKVIWKWNFSEEPMCNIAWANIQSIRSKPILDLLSINPALLKRSKKLKQAVEFRREARSVFPYILTCKNKSALSDLLEKIPKMMRMEEGDGDSKLAVFSLDELCSINSGVYLKEISTLLGEAKSHILPCKFCKDRGHICEGCHSDEVLFPFASVTKCPEVNCGACFHKPCWENLRQNYRSCPRCERTKRRKQPNRKVNSVLL